MKTTLPITAIITILISSFAQAQGTQVDANFIYFDDQNDYQSSIGTGCNAINHQPIYNYNYSQNGAYVYNKPSSVNLYTFSKGTYIFKLNGKNYKNKNVYLPQVRQGNHRLEILRWRQNDPSYGGSTGYWQTLYSGNINVPANSKVEIAWDNRNGLSYQATKHPQPVIPNECQTTENIYTDYNTTYTTNQTTYRPAGMNPTTFQGFLQQLRNASFESSKLTVAKNAIQNNGINVHQMQQVLKEFSFDSSRLEIAKFAHPFTIDKSNYFLLHDSFDFDSNAEALMKSVQ